MAGMPMAMTFSTGTRVTLLFDGWTTTSPGAYVGAILLLFVLSVFQRFLGSLRVQIEKAWLERRAYGESDESSVAAAAGGGREKRRWGRARREKYVADEDGGTHEEKEPLSPRLPVGAHLQAQSGGGRSAFWVPSEAWCWRTDGARALLEFVRAALGYLLMLAVMTFNVGVFFAVLGGILIGELVFGRYSQGGPTRQEDGCHDV
ncbi:Ctr copper transporter [Macrophomina phaseolina]|uniref:Copper transport protein n=1 Tax=Macrophomina phaseolina TaxID=35725 RepID=A0ABQ8G0J4_9PEZI|nr:Ctr copper transporter [Macrophomina phaseolina]